MKTIALIVLLALVGCGTEEEPEGLASESEARVIVSCAVALAGDNYTDENVDAVVKDCPHGGKRHLSIEMSDYSSPDSQPVLPFWSMFEFANKSGKPVPITIEHSGRPCPMGGVEVVLRDRYGTGAGNGCKVELGEVRYRISAYYGGEARYKELKRLDVLGEPLASVEFRFAVKKAE